MIGYRFALALFDGDFYFFFDGFVGEQSVGLALLLVGVGEAKSRLIFVVFGSLFSLCHRIITVLWNHNMQ